MGVRRDTAWPGPFLVMAAIVIASSCHDWPPCGGATCPITEWEAVLSGGNQIPPVATNSSGTGMFRLTNPSQITYTITITALPATSITTAAIYRGSPTTNSDSVAFGLCGTGSPVPPGAALVAPGVLIAGTLAITPSQLNTLRSFGYYANVRTAGNPNGEIRGMVRNIAP